MTNKLQNTKIKFQGQSFQRTLEERLGFWELEFII